MTWARLARFVLLLAAVTLGALTLVVLLPHDKYLRYQALNDGQAPTAYWAYERINRDPTPIDVAFIGTSRTGFAIHSARMQADLARSGIHANVVNLHIVKMGRNMQYVMAKELLTHRAVRLLVLEMDDEEDRSPQPDFIFLADSIDVVQAPLFINLRYFSDLARLPGRQLGLFIDTQLQERHWMTPSFVPPPYEGPHLDHAEFIRTLDGVRHDHNAHHTKEDMETLRRHEDADATPRVLPKSFDWLEYRFPRYYIDKILALAAKKDTRVAFLYLPRFGAPQTCILCTRLYSTRGAIINPSRQMQDYSLWDDAVHMNWDGAKRVTDYVAQQIDAMDLLAPRSDGGTPVADPSASRTPVAAPQRP